MKHEWKPVCSGCECSGCGWCDGGLECCVMCGSFEGATTTHCPGAQMDPFTARRVYDSDLDFVNGQWCRNPNSFAGSTHWWAARGGSVDEVRAEVDRVHALASMERAKIIRGW